MRRTYISRAAITLLAISTLLGSVSATAEEANRAGKSSLLASQEPVVCGWLVTNNVPAHQARWGCWEPATGYVRTAISSMSLENDKDNELQSFSEARRIVEGNGAQLPFMW